ncbi:MAG: recombination mediator RecR [Pseudomonadota bacterium]
MAFDDDRAARSHGSAGEGGHEIERLIQLLARLPGLGPRSARRAALHLITRKDALMSPLAAAMADAVERVVTCSICGNIDTSDPCALCRDPRRDGSTIIVVEDVSDLWALERADVMNNATYHVLGGVLSPLDGVGPEDLAITQLVERAADAKVSEIIRAVNATVEGQTTAHYITDQLRGMDVNISRLAHGVPVGGELDYLDEGTLSAALRARTKF